MRIHSGWATFIAGALLLSGCAGERIEMATSTPSQVSASAAAVRAKELRIGAPYATSSKADVIRRGIALDVPFVRTLSCMKPAGEGHCGTCSKCRERHDAFVEAGVADGTTYASVEFTRL